MPISYEMRVRLGRCLVCALAWMIGVLLIIQICLTLSLNLNLFHKDKNEIFADEDLSVAAPMSEGTQRKQAARTERETSAVTSPPSAGKDSMSDTAGNPADLVGDAAATTSVYPSVGSDDDRILSQLAFVPTDVRRHQQRGEKVPIKRIHIYKTGVASWGNNIKPGSVPFREQQCAVQSCEFMEDWHPLVLADVVVTKTFVDEQHRNERTPHQIWVVFSLESPAHTSQLTVNEYATWFNWTATYRQDSTIVAPYEKYVPFNNSMHMRAPTRNFAAGKTKKVAWFVSNCESQNDRLQYAKSLRKYIQVDIYGRCGDLRCPRENRKACFEMLSRDYKFYLSFENSNCHDYITEKFFVNGLQNDVIPVVMGAPLEDYKRSAPPHSYIHVNDFSSPSHLAQYLHELDKNDSLYNEYFAWKGLWQTIDTKFWCRVCALAHDVDSRGPSWYEDVNEWWYNGMCRSAR